MDLLDFLQRSQSTDAFKADVRAFLKHEPAPRVGAARLSPRVKVARVLTQLLHAEPDLPIERVWVDGVSGCSDYRGAVTVEAAGESRRFDFVWCCQWRADEEGWVDAFGFSDQIRAAQQFDWRCFQQWREAAMSGAEAGGR